MARISSYSQDTSVEGGDRLVGTSSDGTTKTYTLDKIGQYYIENNVVSVAGQQNYRFVTNVNNVSSGTFFVQGHQSNGAELSTLSHVCISKTNTQGVDVETFLRDLFEDKFKIASSTNPNTSAVYKSSSITNFSGDSSFLRIDFDLVESLGTITAQEIFSFVKIVQSDVTYIHTQDMTSNEWVVNHDLDKYPAVTVVDSGDNVLYTEVEYNDKNNLTIRFVASTSGKAFLN